MDVFRHIILFQNESHPHQQPKEKRRIIDKEIIGKISDKKSGDHQKSGPQVKFLQLALTSLVSRVEIFQEAIDQKTEYNQSLDARLKGNIQKGVVGMP